ncbi:TSC22 domain family protein 2 isoform 2-T2 [Aplochiton taeniatus]
MSKMPAKKKSCFQITSVTQAQVAASSVTDDTESLDDPDESRTEDVSSEIFDVSRADLGVCDRSSSEETLNNVGEAEAAASTIPVNGGFAIKSIGIGHINPQVSGGNVPVQAVSLPSIPTSAAQQPATVPPSVTQTPTTTTGSSSTTTSCSSRFRVIKLDHGTGEPFRRGRWTCTEFYEKDSEGSSISRTMESIKHAVTLDHNVDKDSSVAAPHALSPQIKESTADSGYSVAQHGHPPEPQQPSYGFAPQIGSGASAFQPTGYSAVASQNIPPVQVNIQSVGPQALLPGGPNGVVQASMLPPATQTQQYAYPPHPSGPADYRQQQQQQLFAQGSSTQTIPMTSLSVCNPASQGPSPANTPAGPGAQGLGMVTAGGELPSGQAALSQSQLVQGGGGASTTSAQNVPAAVPSTTSGLPGSGGLHLVATLGLSNQPDDGLNLGKDVTMKPFIPESLNLATPTVSSLFGITIPIDGDEDSASGASVVAIDNKIEQAMDLVKSHLMYAVREEVEVLKEQIKELYERNSMLERENAVLKSLANTEQLTQLSAQNSPVGSTSPPQLQPTNTPPAQQEGGQNAPQQSNVTSV